MNWDDLRVATAVYETGSFAAAAARLRINETTVARRLSRLQEDLGVTLFEAMDGARTPTPECQELVALAARMAGHAERIAKLGEEVAGVVGRRRIATTDSIAVEVLAPRLADFLAENPGLSLDFLASTENVNFSRWEADIAVRFGRPDKGDFLVSKLADVSLYLLEPVSAEEGQEDVLCAYPPDLDGAPESQFLAGLGVKESARCMTKNVLVVKKIVRSGRGRGILPSYICADLLGDAAFKATALPERRALWLLVQPHLKGDPATRAVVDWIKDCFKTVD